MTNLNSIKKKLSKENRKISAQDPSNLLAEFINCVVINLMKNIHMMHKELVDQVSLHLFKQSGKIENQRSWLAMRNYLEQLENKQLNLMLKEAA